MSFRVEVVFFRLNDCSATRSSAHSKCRLLRSRNPLGTCRAARVAATGVPRSVVSAGDSPRPQVIRRSVVEPTLVDWERHTTMYPYTPPVPNQQPTWRSGGKPARSQNAYLNWYKITEPTSEPQRILSVRDTLRANEAHQITIENAAFLLSPAQRITTGPPSELPDGLNSSRHIRLLNALK